MRKVIQRFKEEKGETLAETMVSALIAGIGLLMLSSMLIAAQRIITNSNDAVKNFYQEMNQIENRTAASESKKVVIEDIEGTRAEINVTVYQSDGGEVAAYAK